MLFLFNQLRQLGMVAIVMACALLGTVGIIKLIKKIFPFSDSMPNLFDNNEKQDKKED